MIFFFFRTVERLSEGRPCRGPAKGCEGNWLFSYHSRHSSHILFLFLGAVALMHASQEALTSSQPHIVFSFVLNINWIPDGYVTPFNCMHNAASQEGKYWLLIVKSVVVFYKGVVSLTVTSPDHLLFTLDLQRTGLCSMHTCLQVFLHLGV